MIGPINGFAGPKGRRLRDSRGWPQARPSKMSKAKFCEGPSEQRAPAQPDPSEASGQPQKKTATQKVAVHRLIFKKELAKLGGFFGLNSAGQQQAHFSAAKGLLIALFLLGG